MVKNIWNNKVTLEKHLQEIVRFVSERVDKTAGEKKYKYRNVWNMQGLNEVNEFI